MFSQISWETYLTTISIITATYYGIIFLRFYAKDVTTIIKAKSEKSVPDFFNTTALSDTNPQSIDDSHLPNLPIAAQTDQQDTDEFDRIEELIKRVKAAITTAAQNPPCQPALGMTIRTILLDYPELKNSEHREAITEHIHSQCEHTGSDTAMREEDIDELWPL